MSDAGRYEGRSVLVTGAQGFVRGTYYVLEACRAVGVIGDPVAEIVVASSDKAYGSHEELPYREDFPLQPRFPYDTSKACADLIARCYAATYELPVAVTRLANVYGGGDLNWSRIVPDTAQVLVKEKRPVIRSDGTPERDLPVRRGRRRRVSGGGRLARAPRAARARVERRLGRPGAGARAAGPAHLGLRRRGGA